VSSGLGMSVLCDSTRGCGLEWQAAELVVGQGVRCSSSSKSAVGSGTARGSDDVPHAAEKLEQLNS
jgi:hypothetical protein